MSDPAQHLSAQDAALRLNLAKTRRGWRGACPACGYSTTFELRARGGDASGYCYSCQDRGAIDAFLARLRGGDAPPAVPMQRKDDPAAKAEYTAKAMGVWNGAVAVPGTPAERYLTGRGIGELASCAALRWRPDVHHPDGARVPAMLALVQDAQGRPLAVHRHFLTADGRKAALTPPKASFGPIRGGFVQLGPIAQEMVVGEGVESAASASLLFGLPALAGIAAGNIERAMELPAEVRSVVIAADHDPVDERTGRRPGHWAANTAAERWQREGRRVRIAMPDIEGTDFNDVLMTQHGVVPHG